MMRRMRRWRPVTKAMVGLATCLALLLGAAGGTLLWAQHRLDDRVVRVDVFGGLADRPARVTSGPAEDATNILLMGTDGRTSEPTTGTAALASWTPGEQRTDTLMILHIAADLQSASVISFPRDSWVDVPGHGMAKINAGFSYGGPALAVRTVERLTSVRIDHIAWIDWAGFRDLTDALGGVTVYVPHTVYDSARGVTWTRGPHDLDGAEALTYVRQRHGLAEGDLDRIQRQQYFLRSMMDATRHKFSITNPRTSYDILSAVTGNLTVDSGFSTSELRGLMTTMTGMKSSDVEFLTAPVSGLGWEGDQSVVYLNRERGLTLWRAIRDDKVTAWAEANPDTKTPHQVS